jgi:ubiquinone/menaquinone biosynthesis C-methylase UbiE
MMKQKDSFLKSEGDAWFNRNREAIENRQLPEGDPILSEILKLPPPQSSNKFKVLEVGCCDGYRLEWLQMNMGCQCCGIEPSGQAVDKARQRGLEVYQGTADELSFPDNSFDIVTFGFCLYLCDRDDLFRIAKEADRVLMDPGWLIIHDFYSTTPIEREYCHLPGLFSYKMDYRTLFTWHPAYTCFRHTVTHHGKNVFTDDPQEWVATSVLRKCLNRTNQ